MASSGETLGQKAPGLAEGAVPRPVLVDLHLHTTASDGRLSPTEVVRLAARRGLRVIAITDHDSMEGITEAQQEAKTHPNLIFIPGVELSTDVPEGEVHILGYFLDPTDPVLGESLMRFRNARVTRARRMVEKLAALGVRVDWKRVVELAAGGAIGRPHIALAMVEKGYIANPQEAFIRYIGRTGPAYVEREKLTPVEAVALVKRRGGLPVLAHPLEDGTGEAILPSLKEAWLVGLEVYYGNYDTAKVRHLLALAKHYDLVPCGGSDFHGLGMPVEAEPGSMGPPMQSALRLLALAGVRT